MNTFDWMSDANCLDEDPELFFLGTPNANKAAKEVCAGCGVQDECDLFAKAIGADDGVWGNLTERQRAVRKPRNITQVAECGTAEGYARHQARRERSCADCKAAHQGVAA